MPKSDRDYLEMLKLLTPEAYRAEMERREKTRQWVKETFPVRMAGEG